MNRNQLALLVVVLLILGGAGLLLVKHNQESWSAPEGRLGQKLFPNFQANDVAAIHIKGDADVDLVRKNDTWKVQQRGDYPANFSQIRDLLIKLGGLKIGQSDDIGPSQYARLHLEDPGKGAESATLLELKDNSGKPIQSLLVGKKHTHKSEREAPSPFGEEGFPDGRYVMLKSDTKTVLTISDPLNTVDEKAPEWLNKDFFKVEKPRSIAFVSTNASNSWKLTRETESSPWVLADPKPGEMLDSNKVSSLASSLTYPSFVDVATNPMMEHPLQVAIDTFDHFTYAMKVGAKTPENDYDFSVAVSATLPAERAPGKDEKPDDKKKLDKEFADKLKASQDRLAQEQSLANWTYVVNGWLVDPLIRDRAQLLVEKKEPATNAVTQLAPPPAQK